MAIAQIINSNEVSNSSSNLILLSSSKEALKQGKQEVEMQELSTLGGSSTRAGKKTELMPTGNQTTQVNIHQYGEDHDPMSRTSIYFRLSNFYNQLMNTNQEQMGAQASALSANQSALNVINEGFQHLAAIESEPDSVNKQMSGILGGLGNGLGLAAVITGIVFCATGVLAPLGVALIIGGVASIVVSSTLVGVNCTTPGTLSFLSNSQNTGGQAIVNQTKGQALSGFSTAENNETNRNMQGLQSVNSLQQQFANMFAQMLSNYSNSMGGK